MDAFVMTKLERTEIMESPLDLKKDILCMEKAINDCGNPTSVGGNAKLCILKKRLEMLHNGIGFSGQTFCSVYPHEIDEFIHNA